MHRLLIVMFAAAATLCGCGPRNQAPSHPHASVLPQEAVPLGPLSHEVVPSRYRIALTIDPAKDGFSGHVEIDVDFKAAKRSIFLHGRDLNVLAASVRLDARHSIPAHYMQVDGSGVARLIFVDAVPAGKATLVFDYEAPFGKSLSGLYKVVDRGDAYAFTQFESISAREAFPSFDEPGFKTMFQLGVTAPANDRVVSNTPEARVTKARDGMTTTLFQWTRPLPTYLIALAVGPLDIVDGGDIPPNQYRSKPVHLRGVTARGNGQRIRYALSLTPKIVMALENYFGMSYPFQKLDVLAVPDFAAGAMENAGAITFRERLLLLDPDASVDQKRASLSVQAHELTHQWFGDLVTPAWWDDIWLNESFASWMADKASQTVMPDEQFDTERLRSTMKVMDLDELPSAREIHQPVANANDIENAFDAITYDKGAAVLGMFEGYIGEDVFRKGIHAYLTRFATRNATANDFIGTIAETAATQPHAKPENVTIAIAANGAITWNGHAVPGLLPLMDQLSHMSAAISPQQLSAAFANFIDQPGIPELKVRLQCDGAASAHVTQSMYTPIGAHEPPRQWHVPSCMSAAGRDKYCRLLDRRSADVLLGATCPAALMPNDEGRGYYRYAVDDANRAALIKQIASADPSEQISLLYDLAASLHAGEASATDLLHAIHNVAPSARWDVLDAIDDILHSLRVQSGVAGPDLAAYRDYVRTNFAARMSGLGIAAQPGEKPSEALLREGLATLLVSEAHDPQTVAELAKASQDLVNGSPNGLAPELYGEAMRAGLIANGAPFANALVKAFLASNQEYFRRQIVYAFAASEDPAAYKPLLALALTPRMRAGELRYLYEYFAGEPVASQTLWSWLKANFDRMLARVSRDGMQRAPGTLGKACDAASRSDLDAFFGPKTAGLTGTPRTLAHADEAIVRCMAFRAAKSVEIANALHAP